jgi:hypothetical protein
MNEYDRFNVVTKHAWTEPRFRAEIEWSREFGLVAQLFGQVPRHELETYAATGQHVNPEREITLVQYEEPDWDWWEPTSEWRRKAARDRELDRLLAR